MLDLFAIAEADAVRLHAAFDSTLAALPSEQAASVIEFATWVEREALISINVRLYLVVDLLVGERYQNIHEWAQEQARLSGKPAETLLRERLKGFYDQRMAFDWSFQDGERFRYGAMNAGGAGLTAYGPYCAVLCRAFQDSLPPQLAYLPGDSLTLCFPRGGAFDPQAVERGAAPHSHRHLLAAKERAAEIPATGKKDWAALLAAPGAYFEAIFTGEIALNAIECARVLKGEYDRMWDMAFESFGRKLGDAERALAHDFIQLLRARADGKIRLEVLG